MALLGRKLLAGGPAGEEDRARLSAAIPEQQSFTILDFAHVAALTPSYFAKGLAPLWTERETVLGATSLERVRDDLQACLERHDIAMWDLDSEPAALGPLDTSAKGTLAQCLAHSQVTAGFLAQQHSRVRPTAWSNRLANLYAKRLVNRTSVGRRTLYYLPWHTLEGDDYGH